jgi:biotin-(acetyl-CoA carboxylase) ligase
MTERSIVIAALRQKNGNPDEAGDLIAASREEERLVAKKRMRQRKVGKCSNGSDWVNLDLVLTLAGLLGFNVEHADHDDSSDSEGDADSRDQESISTSIVTGLLRLTNNNMEESLQLYNQIGAEKVFQRVEELDKLYGRRKHPREDRMMNSKKQRVQDVDVAILVSMGVEDSKAREALRATGNVDAALVWLSTVSDDHSDSPAAAAAANDVDRTINDPQRSNSNEDEALDAEKLLKSVLENALGNSKNLENEWLGIDLNDEWDLIEKYSINDT